MVVLMMSFVEKLGRFRLTFLITLVAFLASQFITYTTYYLMESEVPLSGKIASVVSPVLITPILSWWFIGLLLRIRELEQQMRELAAIDSLTGLYNRNSFMIAFESLVHFIKRSKMNLVILFIDLDNFKQINDTFGHDVGDLVLQQFAGFLKESLRESDFVGRIGGDEFIMCLPNTDYEGGRFFAEKLRKGIMQNLIVTKNELLFSVTVSIGLSMYGYMDEIDLGKIIKDADLALHSAKTTGKNKIYAGLQEVQEILVE
jgi:diguanylate cyclase